MTAQLNAAYMARLTTGIMGAVMEASMVDHDGQRTAMVMSAEAVDVLVTTIAGLVAGSEAANTPAKRRRWCDDVARLLQRRIAAFQQHAAAGGATMPTVTINPS